MNIADAMAMELQHEGAVTRKCLERVPEEKFSYKPHEKSMSLGQLASHIAEANGWMQVIVNEDLFDMDASGYTPYLASNRAELLSTFDAKLAEAIGILQSTPNDRMMAIWKMKMGGKIGVEMPRVAVVRGFVISHMVHHRGQLSVYLRLNNVPVPSIYGPSADEAG